MRLLAGSALEAVLPQLHIRLAQALLDDPPYELRWLSSCKHQVLLAHASPCAPAGMRAV